MDSGEGVPVVYDPYFRCWREPDARETGYLFPDRKFLPPQKRSGKWSRWQKLRGRLGYQLNRIPLPPRSRLLFCPELFDVKRDHSIFSVSWSAKLPKVAYFYDAIPYKFPEWTPEKTVARYPDYLKILARFDHVTCISRASELDLHESWEELKVRNTPPTSAIPLGLPLNREPATEVRDTDSSHTSPVVLMVGTLEARKNHLAVLEACQTLWQDGLDFELRLAGMLNRETGEPAARKIDELKDRGLPIVWEGAVSNNRLAEAYIEADIFLYPSLYEGFGLPVLESLAHGLPTITTQNGALSELVEDGGCHVCENSAESIADALRLLLVNRNKLRELKDQARGRPIRSMRDTARELGLLFQELTGNPRSLAR